MKTTARPFVRLTLLVSLVVWTVCALKPLPRLVPLPANAPDDEFSAGRALVHVAAIAQKPHPPGSAEHDRVRDYIRAEIARQGLTAEMQDGVQPSSMFRRGVSLRVENILARFRGKDNTLAVMLAAHYDSTPAGPGAADDGHGVAVLLETLRALRSGSPLRNDVILLFTDGEETGLMGALYFMREHPWRHEPGVVLNFEARGTAGVPEMFETSSGNEWLIRDLQAAVPEASATSMAYEVYRRMPNSTDLSVFKLGLLPGLNSAFIEHPEFYHRPQDDVAHLDLSSLQEQGRFALALTRRLGGEDLSPRETDDAVYFRTRWSTLTVYPFSWVKPLAAITILALLVVIWIAWHRRVRGTWIGVPLAVIGVLLLTVAKSAPGVSYLLEWPLAAGIVSFLVLITSPRLMGIGWRLVIMLASPAAVFLLLVALLPTLMVALGPGQGFPVVVIASLIVLTTLLPELVLALRRSREQMTS